MIDVLLNKSQKTIFSLTAARGRGKSAAIGLGIAAALKIGYSNIYVTAPSPKNLKTLFEFVSLGLEIFGHKKGLNYQIEGIKIESKDNDFKFKKGDQKSRDHTMNSHK